MTAPGPKKENSAPLQGTVSVENPARESLMPGHNPEPPVPPEPSADEQMALYEKELKENDWGHQPC